MSRHPRPLQGPDDPRHGTQNAYGNFDCRCDRCREAHALAYRIAQQDRRLRGLSADDPRHGMESTYKNWSCRCSPCTEAHRLAHARWKETVA